MSTHKHKFKVGDRVLSEGIPGTIFTIGYATPNTSDFSVCKAGAEIPDTHPLGYQVDVGHKIKIMRESDLTAL
jgi:hypothetical protein